MAVSHEIKSQLAKLLATEDLVVEHRKVETACFNVHTRVLTLPMWEKASNKVYDMLVGHEVGHALYTPDENWIKEHKIPPQFVNIVEDVRIEKLMKRRYAGISKTFYHGYKELSDQDFFGVECDDISKMNLADRVNLYFKVGSFCDIFIKDGEEKEIVNMIDSTETFADVLFASKILYEYCKKKQSDQAKDEMNPVEGNSKENGNSSESNSDVSHKEYQENAESIEEENETSETSMSPDFQNQNKDNEPEIKTMSNFEESLKELIDDSGSETGYYEIPEINIENIIISNAKIHDECNNSWKETISEDISFVDNQYTKFKKSVQKEVNYLVKEFECRKSADSYARAITSRTGVLDTGKLHTYKYNEDLFKKVTVLPDGKNHGLIFILDWSGSMSEVLLDTIKQMFNLIWFCKKVNIPFEVYAFTCDYPNQRYADNPQPLSEKRVGVFSLGNWFSLMNILTSKVNTKELEKQMKNIFRIAYRLRSNVYYEIPPGMGLSGTPLNESLVCLNAILPRFKKEHKLQKVQCIVLTDGEGAPLKTYKEVQRPWEEEPKLCEMWPSQNSFLRDRKTGNTYKLGGTYEHYSNFTTVMLNNLRDRFKDVNFIGIRIIPPREIHGFIKYNDYSNNIKLWKKNKSVTITNAGYHKYFGLSSSALSNQSEFDVDTDATKTQIKNAFVKSLRSKKMNKKILNEFIELIA